ncbi:hypothetical protein [Providencia huaxiensis]|uniref:hypothetical protein n=1 Tax=Providencia huaxiensis TaxID=2027290 RepID=UPI001B362716|nr:hypothetical protein [Providencia huaxiensis]MBQ0534468.1 hypothetical protein [Providencia huaxiensis]MBQ0588152.1 hypothetical protein [Providencia huaxiensis]MDI7239995.1 hypothetical protein [Providencia huaxiensis]
MDYLIIYGMTITLLSGCIWWNWSIVKLNSHSLHLQWLFWIAIIFPIYSCFYFGVIVWIEYPVEVSTKGYSDFLDISRLPLYLLAGSPILGAFVASAHRSYQTDIQIKKTQRQIEMTEEKNQIDIYFSRRKFIIERLENLTLFFSEKIDNANYVYDKFYYFNNYTDEKKISNFELINNRIDVIYLRVMTIQSYYDQITTQINLNSDVKQAALDLLGLSTSLLKLTGLKVKNDLDIKGGIIDFLNIYKDFQSKKEISPEIKSNELKEILKYFIFDITDELNKFEESIRELFTVLLLNEDINKYLPNLNKLHFEHNN